MLQWTMLHPRMTEDMLGLIPSFLDEADPRPAREQFHENYAHGGGWRPVKGWQLSAETPPSIKYPGDPALHPLAETKLRDEHILLYPHAWIVVLQPDGSFELARMD